MCNLCKKGSPGGGGGGGGLLSSSSPMPKSFSFSRKGKISIVDGFVITYLSLVELLDIYHG